MVAVSASGLSLRLCRFLVCTYSQAVIYAATLQQELPSVALLTLSQCLADHAAAESLPLTVAGALQLAF